MLIKANVDKILRETLADIPIPSEEWLLNGVRVEGIKADYFFDKRLLKKYEEEISKMIDCLHPSFMNGWTFLNLAFDKNGNQWGEHPDCENFMAICMAMNKAKYFMPRSFDEILPGGLPYIIFNKDGFNEAEEKNK